MTEQRKEKFFSVLQRRQPGLTVVMEDVHDQHNVSAMLRTADAVGVMEVQLLYVNEDFPKLGRKSSASANKWITRRQFKSVAECYNKLHDEGFVIYATHMGKKSKSLYELDLTKKVAFVFGNEHRGVTAEAAKLADENFLIPQVGMIQSLNVSVACAVTLYEAFRQRLQAGMYDASCLDDSTIEQMLTAWSQPRNKRKKS
ncbi:MAG: RNA methyltransferase [Bacteroidetes bacterium]|nr:MAG: RNA methyltransferase [Bacteroidota bacterium]